MVTENPVYIKLEYQESIQSKKDVLSTEMSLLNIVKSIKNYKELREEEFILRAQMYKLIKEANAAIRKTKTTFPFINLPEKREIAKIEVVKKKRTEKKEDLDLEFQLREIQEKLMRMGS